MSETPAPIPAPNPVPGPAPVPAPTPAPIPASGPSPAPIPARSVPAGARVWSAEDAARWSRARSAPWARPLWSIAALLITVVWAIAASPDPACGDAAPCGTDWVGMAEWGLAAGLVYWLARLPEMTLIAAPALAAVVASVELWGAEPNSLAANVCVLVALAFGWAAALERIAARRRQRALSESAAGVRHPLPGPPGPLRRGTIPIAAGLLLLGAAALCLAQGFAGIRADRHHTDRAVRIVATVIGRDDESVRVRTDDARRLTLDSFYPEDYRVGGAVTVLEDGAWRRLSAEPYDAVGWQLAALAVGLPGLSLLATGLLARRRAAALRRTPVPVLRVLERMDGAGRTWIHAGDDTTGRAPVLVGGFVPERSHAEEHERGGERGHPRKREHGTARHAGEADGGEPFAAGTGPREAVMFGSAYEGAELVLVTTGPDNRPVVLRTAAHLRLPRPGEQPALATGGNSYTASADPDSEPQGPPAPDRVPATLITTGRPLRWGPSALARAGGAVSALCVMAVVASVTRSLVTDGIDWHAAILFGLVAWGRSAAELLNWRVTADSSGLWLSGGGGCGRCPGNRCGRSAIRRKGAWR